MKHFKVYLLISFLSFLAFTIFTLIVRNDVLNPFDFSATVRVQQRVPFDLDIFFSLLSLVGSFDIETIFLMILIFLRRKLVSYIVPALYMGGHFIILVGKSILYHPGPPYMFFRSDLNFLFPQTYTQSLFSYPSGHSFRIVFLTLVVIFIINNTKRLIEKKHVLTALTIIFTILMLISRVSLGEHWTTDVIGGSLLGLALGYLSLLFI